MMIINHFAIIHRSTKSPRLRLWWPTIHLIEDFVITLDMCYAVSIILFQSLLLHSTILADDDTQFNARPFLCKNKQCDKSQRTMRRYCSGQDLSWSRRIRQINRSHSCFFFLFSDILVSSFVLDIYLMPEQDGSVSVLLKVVWSWILHVIFWLCCAENL